MQPASSRAASVKPTIFFMCVTVAEPYPCLNAKHPVDGPAGSNARLLRYRLQQVVTVKRRHHAHVQRMAGLVRHDLARQPAPVYQGHGGKKIEGKVDLTGVPAGAWSRSYIALTRDVKLVPRYPARNQVQITPPGGLNAALGSRLMQLIRKGHEGAKLDDQETRALAAWIDCNAIFYGTPDPVDQARQRCGQPVGMPEIQ